ncbi:hypothetical protein [Dyella sp.]|uniref:hypothetical protein n=1 Tax=Dyella sp. TaxID=1869338 RepID=UPI002FD9687F
MDKKIMKMSSKWIMGMSCALAMVFVTLFTPRANARPDDTQVVVSDITTICAGWPVPTGYVITAFNGFTAACNGVSEYSVSLPAVGMAVCSSATLPDGFVATSEFEDTTACGNPSIPVKSYRLSAVAEGVAMCSGTPRPVGFVTDRVVASNQCLGANAYVLKPVSEGVAACSMSRTPDGYVVTSGTPTGSCTDASVTGDWWTFNQAYDGIQVCPYSPIPAGYYNMGTVQKTDCYGASFGYLLKKG